MPTYAETLRELEIRCIAHKLAAEYYSALDENLKLASSITSVLTASVSYWNALDTFSALNPIGYILPVVATLTALFSVLSAKMHAGEVAEQHLRTSKELEAIWIYCLGESVSMLTAEARQQLVHRAMIDTTAALKDAPLLPTRYQQRATRIVDSRESCVSPTPPPGVTPPQTSPQSPVSSQASTQSLVSLTVSESRPVSPVKIISPISPKSSDADDEQRTPQCPRTPRSLRSPRSPKV